FPPATAGPAYPSATGVRHNTGGPSFGNFCTMPLSRQTLSRCGPCHCGQSSAFKPPIHRASALNVMSQRGEANDMNRSPNYGGSGDKRSPEMFMNRGNAFETRLPPVHGVRPRLTDFLFPKDFPFWIDLIHLAVGLAGNQCVAVGKACRDPRLGDLV